MNNSFFYRNKNIFFGVFILFSIAVFVDGMLLNSGLLRDIARENVLFYGCRQLLAILGLYFIGYYTINPLRGLTLEWHMLFSFPVGMVAWVVPSYIQLLLGIPYTLVGTVIIISVFLILLNWRFPVHEHKERAKEYISNNFLPWLMMAAGLIAASGLNYIFRSFDTYFFFTNYGKTLALWGNYADFVGERVYVFNQVGQFLPIINAYTTMLGLDQCFQIMVFADYMMVLIFGATLYYVLLAMGGKKKSDISPEALKKENLKNMTPMKWTIVATAYLCTCTAFVIGSRWAISNMYCMLYMFVIVSVIFLGKNDIIDKISAETLVAISGMALSILRKDGIILLVFLMIVITCSERYKKKDLFVMFAPGALMELSWIFYVKVVLGTKTLSRQVRYGSTTIASTKNVLFIVVIVVAGILFISIGLELLKFIEKHVKYINRYHVMMAGLLLLIIPCAMKKGWLVFDNFDYTVRNLFGYDSAWGLSAYTLFALLVVACLPRPKLDWENFLWMGYAVLNFVSYSLIDDKVLWVNWDDSYSRVLMQIVPVLVFVCAVKIWRVISES